MRVKHQHQLYIQRWKLQEGVTELTRRASYTISGKFPFPPRISAWICLTEFRSSLPPRTKYRGIWTWMHKVQGEGEVWKMWGSRRSVGRVISTSSMSCLISGKQPDTGTAFSLPHADYAAGESSSMLLSKALHSLFYSSISFFAAQPNKPPVLFAHPKLCNSRYLITDTFCLNSGN